MNANQTLLSLAAVAVVAVLAQRRSAPPPRGSLVAVDHAPPRAADSRARAPAPGPTRTPHVTRARTVTRRARPFTQPRWTRAVIESRGGPDPTSAPERRVPPKETDTARQQAIAELEAELAQIADDEPLIGQDAMELAMEEVEAELDALEGTDDT